MCLVIVVECSATPPTAPTGATMEWSGERTVNAVVKYICSGWYAV